MRSRLRGGRGHCLEAEVGEVEVASLRVRSWARARLARSRAAWGLGLGIRSATGHSVLWAVWWSVD
jgi:hypothetical protein